jgi:hypothetical protein
MFIGKVIYLRDPGRPGNMGEGFRSLPTGKWRARAWQSFR